MRSQAETFEWQGRVFVVVDGSHCKLQCSPKLSWNEFQAFCKVHGLHTGQAERSAAHRAYKGSGLLPRPPVTGGQAEAKSCVLLGQQPATPPLPPQQGLQQGRQQQQQGPPRNESMTTREVPPPAAAAAATHHLEKAQPATEEMGGGASSSEPDKSSSMHEVGQPAPRPQRQGQPAAKACIPAPRLPPSLLGWNAFQSLNAGRWTQAQISVAHNVYKETGVLPLPAGPCRLQESGSAVWRGDPNPAQASPHLAPQDGFLKKAVKAVKRLTRSSGLPSRSSVSGQPATSSTTAQTSTSAASARTWPYALPASAPPSTTPKAKLFGKLWGEVKGIFSGLKADPRRTVSTPAATTSTALSLVGGGGLGGELGGGHGRAKAGHGQGRCMELGAREMTRQTARSGPIMPGSSVGMNS